jgi:hypothetical protein
MKQHKISLYVERMYKFSLKERQSIKAVFRHNTVKNEICKSLLLKNNTKSEECVEKTRKNAYKIPPHKIQVMK